MILDEAIKHAEEVAEEQEKATKEWHENQVRKCKLIPFTEMDYTHENNCKKCAEEHRQLAEWLKDYKRLVDVLDKMKSEILQVINQEQSHDERWAWGLRYAVNIIDKYKIESEVKNANSN